MAWCHVAKTCQQIKDLWKYYSLYGGMWNLFLQGRTLSLYSKFFRGVFGEGTRLAMPKTILRVGLIIIESLVQGPPTRDPPVLTHDTRIDKHPVIRGTRSLL